MAYNQSPNLPPPGAGWGTPQQPPRIQTSLTGGQQNDPYNAPQFVPPPHTPGGSILKTLNFFSPKPSYGTSSSAVSSPVIGPSGGFFPSQGTSFGAGPAPPQTTYNANPIPTYTPAAGGPAGYTPVAAPQPSKPSFQSGQYGPGQGLGLTIPGSHPQQQQQQQQQYQGGGAQNAGYNNVGPSASSAPPPAYTVAAGGYNLPPEKPTMQSYAASQPATVQPQVQPIQPQAQPVQPQVQPIQPQVQPIQPQVQPMQPQAQPVQPQVQPIQPQAQPVQPQVQPIQPQAQPVQPQAQPMQPTNPPVTNIASTNAPVASTATTDSPQYWASLVADSKKPLGPNPKLRAIYQGIAACINKDCTVDHSPSCVFSPTKMAMYYGTMRTYSDRFTTLFLKAQTHPSVLTTLYQKLNCQYLLIPSSPNDGKRKPPSPALTAVGFEHWMMLQVLLNPEEEYRRLSNYIAAPGRNLTDPATNTPIPTTLPREALPAAPDEWVLERYGGLLERGLEDSAGKPEEVETIPDVSGLRKELEWYKKKSTDAQSDNHKAHVESSSLRKELSWFKSKVDETQSSKDSDARKLADAQGEVEFLKRKLDEARAEAESLRVEAEALRRLNKARSESVASVSSPYAPPQQQQPAARPAAARPPYPMQGNSTPAPQTPYPSHSTPAPQQYQTQGNSTPQPQAQGYPTPQQTPQPYPTPQPTPSQQTPQAAGYFRQQYKPSTG